MKFQVGDKVKSNVAGTIQKERVLKRRVPERDEILLGECWEFEEDSFHPYDWDKFYDLVKKPEEEKETYHCNNCGLSIEKDEEFCSGGCAQEHYENHVLFD
jgi:hypothetical protein